MKNKRIFKHIVKNRLLERIANLPREGELSSRFCNASLIWSFNDSVHNNVLSKS
jgi:hypothetical protein